MLTRLKVSGFKNLVDVDVRFGPFTCIAGGNGVGKSNLFDAICFLSALASKTLNEAAMAVREEGASASDIRRLFHQVDGEYDKAMRFEAEMLVPSKAVDDFGQEAAATTTLLCYTLELEYAAEPDSRQPARLTILKEKLTYLPRSNANASLLFPHKPGTWRKSVLTGKHRTADFISSKVDGNGTRVVMLHQDGGGHGQPLSRPAQNLPRTILSGASAAECPTVLCAKREMESWRRLQLEPSALRQYDEINAPHHLDMHGGHLPATLFYLAGGNQPDAVRSSAIYSGVANRLGDLIDDVRSVSIDKDDKRENLTLMVSGRDGTLLPARSLSDGTLRFLALAVMDLDTQSPGVICLEEPENGIHPERIPAMLQLLQNIASDTDEAVAEDNPLRQVIINTHSPIVVAEVDDDSILVAYPQEVCQGEKRFHAVAFGCLPDTWRTKADPPAPIVAKGELLAYLNPINQRKKDSQSPMLEVADGIQAKKSKPRNRVADRNDLQILLPGLEGYDRL
jgi:predicted ATPase